MANKEVDDESDGFVTIGPKIADDTHILFDHNHDGDVVGVSANRPVKDGEPLPENSFFLQDMEDERGYRRVPISTHKPAMVNSRQYKDGWDSIFGTKIKAGEA